LRSARWRSNADKASEAGFGASLKTKAGSLDLDIPKQDQKQKTSVISREDFPMFLDVIKVTFDNCAERMVRLRR
jgi:hypothetical protein